MPRSYPPEVRRQVIELARSGTRVAPALGDVRDDRDDDLQLAQAGADRPRRGGRPTTDQQLELAAAKRRIKQLETELAVARKVNEVFLKEGISPKGSSR